MRLWVSALFVTLLAGVVQLRAQTVAGQPQVKPKLGGAAVAVAPRANVQAPAAMGGNPAAELGYAAAIPDEEKIRRLQKKVAQLVHQLQALQREYESLNTSLGALAKSTITFRCERMPSGEWRSYNSLGAWVSCSPYTCDSTAGRCYRPPCVTSDECTPGYVCDVGQSNLCVSASGG